MIHGIGTDIVLVARVVTAIQRSNGRFIERVFTPAERDYCLRRRASDECFAARFAGKEAVLKALGTGLSGCKWTDIEILPGPSGQPEVRLQGRLAVIAAGKGVAGVLLSLSHDSGRALAFSIALAGTTSDNNHR